MRIDIRETNNTIKQGQIRKNNRSNRLALVVDGFQHNGTKYVRYLRIDKPVGQHPTQKHDIMAMAVSELRIFEAAFPEPYSGAMQIQATPAEDLVDVDYPEYARLRNIMYKRGYFNEKKQP